MKQTLYKRNVPLFFVYQWLGMFVLDRAIWMLFLVSKGLTLGQIALLETLYHGMNFLCEVPTGMIADRLGKRTSLLMAQGVGIVSAIWLMTATDFYGLTAAFMLGSLVHTLQSGAASALFYETLKGQGRRHEFSVLNSRLSSLALVSMGISGMAGGALSDLSWSYVYGGKAILHIALLFVIWRIEEPVVHADEPDERSEEAEAASEESGKAGFDRLPLHHQIGAIFRFIGRNKAFAALSVFGAVLYAMFWSIGFYSQVLFEQAGLSKGTIGVVNGAETWFSAAVAAVAYFGERLFGRKGTLYVAAFGFMLAFALFSFQTGGVGTITCFFLMALFISGLEPLLETYLHELVPSAMRATMLSVFSMMISAGMMVTFMGIGLLADVRGLSPAVQAVMIGWLPIMAIVTLVAARIAHAKWCHKPVH
ncbi:MFS transporter [Paenibacillus sp. MBLB4367]|uniref:MFS transporter n=1 Tax=Paenibacillus sp. MBLB4367 TaxID=3384767 RepID=UPI00390826C4